MVRPELGGRREVLVLAGAAVSAAALVGTALSSYGDPDLAGRAALARLSGEVAGGVAGEWERLRREPELLSGAGELLEWSGAPPPLDARAARDLRAEREPRRVVFDALLSEAHRIEREEADPGRALELVLDALGKDADPPRRTEARLFALQLAAHASRPGVAREQWKLAAAELRGDEALGGTSALLLCALAAAPALPAGDRAAARERLVELWIGGGLALPPVETETGGTAVELRSAFALRDAFRARLQELAPGAPPDARLARSALDERARVLADRLGGALDAPADGGAGIRSANARELVFRRADPETIQGRFLPRGTVAQRLESEARERGLLPAGFLLDFDGDGAGEVVRERTALAGDDLGFVLRHAEPERVVSAVGERQALLRWALLVLAVLVAGAGVAASRALRRERHLARLRSTFVANVSHELRTPVSSILLMAENLERGRVSDDTARRRYVSLIRREARRLRRLVDDVLDFSRIERGRGVPLALEEIDVPRFADELEAEARERVTESGGELSCARNGVPERLHADGEALRRATFNLLDNALVHSGETRVELALAGDGAGGLVIRVRDRGRGVPAGRLGQVFRPFERGERVQGPDGRAGTGLGLAIVREIAEGHGGSARAVVPDDGPGIVFELRVPAATGGEEQA